MFAGTAHQAEAYGIHTGKHAVNQKIRDISLFHSSMKYKTERWPSTAKELKMNPVSTIGTAVEDREII